MSDPQKAFSFRGLCPLTTWPGALPWTSLGALLPDPCYRLTLHACHGQGPSIFLSKFTPMTSGIARNFDWGACTWGSGSSVAQRFWRFASGASKKIFDPPHLLFTWGDIKQDDTVFITAIMTWKRLCSHAPNDYNSGLCDYYGYAETESMKECHCWVLITVYYIHVKSFLQIVCTEYFMKN